MVYVVHPFELRRNSQSSAPRWVDGVRWFRPGLVPLEGLGGGEAFSSTGDEFVTEA